jgi:hypothetical protein
MRHGFKLPACIYKKLDRWDFPSASLYSILPLTYSFAFPVTTSCLSASVKPLSSFRINTRPLRSPQTHSSLTQTFLAGRWIDFTTGLRWLLDLGKPRAVASGAFDLRYFLFRSPHKNLLWRRGKVRQIKFAVARSTCPMSLCWMTCWLRLSHLMVTPAQFVSVTVPRSA